MAKERTYAQQAKTIMNKYKLRLGDKFDKGDPLAVAAMNAELTALQKEQEESRAVARQEEIAAQEGAIKQFAKGGKLDKNQKSALGRAFAEQVDLEQNRAKFNREQGLPKDTISKDGVFQSPSGDQVYPEFNSGGNLFQQGFNQFGTAPQLQMPQQMGLGAYQAAQSGGVNLANQGTMGLNMNQAGGGQTFMNNFMNQPLSPSGGGAPVGGGTEGFASRVPWSSAISGVGDIIANSIPVNMPKYDYQEYKPTKAQANLVDYRREREQVMAERNLANAQIARSARNRGSQAGLMENILAGQTATQRTAGQQFGQSLEREGNVNAQIKNQIQAQNLQKEMGAFQINTRNKQFANQLARQDASMSNMQKQNIVRAGTGMVSGYLQDRAQASQYDQMVNMEMARNPNYSLQQADPTFWRRFAGITDPIEKINFTNTGDTVTG
jgi:hypothetical protein